MKRLKSSSLFVLIISLGLLGLCVSTMAASKEDSDLANESEHIQPIISPPQVPIGPIMPVRRSQVGTLSGAELRQTEVEEEPRKESLWRKLTGWFKNKEQT